MTHYNVIMFASIKQLFADLQDKSAGQKISSWPLKTPLIIYTKLFLLLAAIVVLTSVYLLVYFVPQLPKIVSETVPDITVSMNQKQLSITPPEPLILSSPEGSLIVDTRDNPDDYSSYPAGVFIYRDRIESKDGTGLSQTINFENVPDFDLSTSAVVNWLTANKNKIIWTLLAGITVISPLLTGIVWLSRLLSFYLASSVIFIMLKVFKRPLPFSRILPVVVYASILPLLISYILFFAPHPLLNFLNLGLFVFFTLSWLLPLTSRSVKNPNKALPRTATHKK